MNEGWAPKAFMVAAPAGSDVPDPALVYLEGWSNALASKAIAAVEIATLTDRIARATAALQTAPDVIADEASKRQAKDVAAANRVAWAILTEGQAPESVRHTGSGVEALEGAVAGSVGVSDGGGL